MKIERRNLVLAAILVGLGCLDFGLTRSASSTRPIEALFPSISEGRAQRISLEHAVPGGGAAQRLTIEKRGDEWVLPDFHGYPARKAMVLALFDRLTAMTNIDLLAADASAHGDYGVDDSGLVLVVSGEDGESLAGLVQGKLAPRGSSGRPAATYVRPVGDNHVYRAPRFGTLGLDPKLWLDARFLRFATTGVRALTISGSACKESKRLVRRDAKNWRDAGDGSAADGPLVEDLLSFLEVLFFDQVLAPFAEPMEQPFLEFALDVGTDEPLRVQFGDKQADDSRSARSSASPFLLSFGSDAWKPLLTRAHGLAGQGSED